MLGKKKDGQNAGDGSIVIGGNVDRSNIVMGNNNVVTNKSVNLEPLFKIINGAVDKASNLSSAEKSDVKADLKEIHSALEEPHPDETFIARRLRNIQRMAPDIVEVAFETLKNPIGGVVEVVKRVAARMAEEANAK